MVDLRDFIDRMPESDLRAFCHQQEKALKRAADLGISACANSRAALLIVHSPAYDAAAPPDIVSANHALVDMLKATQTKLQYLRRTVLLRGIKKPKRAKT